MRSNVFSAFAAIVLTACGLGDSGGDGLPYRTVADSAGDTLIARTIGPVPDELVRHLVVEWRAGGAESDSTTSLGDASGMAVGPAGNVFVWDHATPSLWLVSADGKNMKGVGRVGAGPGEYDQVNGLAARPDGKLVVWDAGNARLNLYDADGVPVTSWKLPFGGHYTSNALTADTEGRTWMRSSVRKPDEQIDRARAAWFRWDSAGTTMDTVFAPVYPASDPPLVARRQDAGGTSTSSQSVPFGTAPLYAVSPIGTVVSGPGRPYIIDTEHGGRPLRIERDFTPVALTDAERQQRRVLIEFNMRRTQANWVWNGPDIPSDKPPYASIAAGLDGRVWVQLHVASEAFEPDPPRTTAENPPPLLKFRPKERQWDVFEPDGRYLGRVAASRLFTPYAMRGNHVWGVLRDDDDVPSVVKMRIEPPL
jgi:hypothetical protein